jgi:DNA polymerase-3 subunit epsilon
MATPAAELSVAPATGVVALRADALRGRVACVDLETTGGLSAHHRIIEVGIVQLDDGVVVEQWSTLVQPGVRIPPSIAAFTGIDDLMVAEAPTFEEVADQVLARIENRLFVAHNARFDYGFLRNEFRRVGVRFTAPVLCTVRLSRSMYREHPRHNLDTLMERFGLVCTARHRALGDAQVLPALLAAIESDRGSALLQESVVAALHEPRLPVQLPADLAEDLPEAPGVYIFRGADAVPLYIGRGRNIRSRVFDHFAHDKGAGTDSQLARDVRSIEWIETGGELGALLLESRLVKELSPTGNRRFRHDETDCVLRLVRGDQGLNPQVRPLEEAVEHEGTVVFGPFRTERDAWRALEGKVREAGLCLKTLGREKAEGSCVAFQMGKCRGACTGAEPRALHDARLQMTLASLKLRSWPFEGPVGIREPAPDTYGTQVHVLDRWRHLGTARDEREIDELLRRAPPVGFDADSYRIISRTLKDVRPSDLVVLRRSSSEP